jgi:hypothetical protein
MKNDLKSKFYYYDRPGVFGHLCRTAENPALGVHRVTFNDDLQKPLSAPDRLPTVTLKLKRALKKIKRKPIKNICKNKKLLV